MSRVGAAFGPQVDRLVALMTSDAVPLVMLDTAGWVRAGCRVEDENVSWNLRAVNLGATALLLEGHAVNDRVVDDYRAQLSGWLAEDERGWCGPEQGSTVYGHLVRSALHAMLDAPETVSGALRRRVLCALGRFNEWWWTMGDTPVGNRCDADGPYSSEYAAWAGFGPMPPNWKRGNRQALWARTRSWGEVKAGRLKWPSAAECELRLRDPVVVVLGTAGKHACLPMSTAPYIAPGVQFIAAQRDGEPKRFVHEKTRRVMPDDAVRPLDIGIASEALLIDGAGRHSLPMTGGSVTFESASWRSVPTVVFRGADGVTVMLRSAR